MDRHVLRKNAEVLDIIADNLIDVIASKSKLDKEEVETKLKEETYYSAKQALKEGLVDEILPPNKESKTAMTNMKEVFDNFQTIYENSLSEKLKEKVRKEETIEMPDNKTDEQVLENEDTKTDEVQAKVDEPKNDIFGAEELRSQNKKLEERVKNLELERDDLKEVIKEFKNKEKLNKKQKNEDALENAKKRGAVTPVQAQYWEKRFEEAYDEASAEEIRNHLNELESSDYFKIQGKAYSVEDVNYYPQERVEGLRSEGNTDEQIVQILQREIERYGEVRS